MIFVLFGISVIVFYLSRGFPSGMAPWTPYIHERMTAEEIQRVIKEHGFDRPLWEQYIFWLRDILRGDWGRTGIWAQGLPADQVFFQRFPYTIELAVSSTLFAILVGIPLGVVSAIRQNKLPDHVTRLVALAGYSTPVYWFGFILQLVFFYYFSQWGLPNLPSSGASDLGTADITGIPIIDGLIKGDFEYVIDEIRHLILPTITISFVNIGFLVRLVRASMLEVLRQDYIIMARSKGLKERVVIYRHALRNALIPAVTLAGIFFAFLLGGALITEYVFSWPGVGHIALRAVFQGDSNFLLLYTLVVAVIVVITNVVVDVLYTFLDPRIRY
jgi:peptide/nickel transport system permease protein